MAVDAKRVTVGDTLRLLLFVGIPVILGGLVAPRPRFVPALARRDAAGSAVRFLAGLRRKYGSSLLWTWFPFARTLLVLDAGSASEVLASDATFADPWLKVRALSGITPDGVIVSSGEPWRWRREFNEQVLDFGRLHRHQAAFTEIVAREVDRLASERPRAWRWADFAAYGSRVSHQVVLGRDRVDADMAAHLARLVTRGNRLFGRPRDSEPLHGRITAHLAPHRSQGDERNGPDARPAACLMADTARALESGGRTTPREAASQVAFWLLVLKDGVELHAARTLALIAAHPDVQYRVRQEVLGAPGLTGEQIDGFKYLDACLEEELRLWTAVPILLRRTVSPFALHGSVPIRAGDQVLVHAAFNHRDARAAGPSAHRFSPDTAVHAPPPAFFFSQGRQTCAGQFLVRFLLKATLASMLARFRFELIAPTLEPDRIPGQFDHFAIALRPVPDR